MATTFVGSSAWATNPGATTNDAVVPRPTGVISGDVITVAVLHQTALTPPSGWTLIDTDDTGTTGWDLSIYRKVAGSSEPSTYTWVEAVAARQVAVAVAYRGVDPSAPIDAFNTTGDATAQNFVTAPSVTTTRPNEIVLHFFGFPAAASGGGITPGGLTDRVGSGSSPSPYILVSEKLVVSAGVTAVQQAYTPTSAENLGAQIALKRLNLAPYAPTQTYPIGGAVLDRAEDFDFLWIHSDPDTEAQSKYDLRYRIVGAGTWTDTTATTGTTARTITGGTLTAGDYEWQVRTYDTFSLVGPYSGSQFFTAGDQPATPVLDEPDPTDTITAGTSLVEWTVTDQDAYRVRTVADTAGSPNTAIVYQDTGIIVDSVARSATMTFDTDGRDEHVQVQVRYEGLWSDWDTAIVTVDYTNPATPTIVVAVVNDSLSRPFAISVDPTQPAPGVGEPTVTDIDVWRREGDSGDGIALREGAGIDPDDLFTDLTVNSLVAFSYRIRANGDNGTFSWSAWED